ncbi:methyltransferase-like protein 13 [Lingula anatina]|uniref:Methyltransferase-like protein 13 n=1 Tax=Lingula anatina TaxID=7574 RepID=A0A1S3INL1_LINAN|nr:methyltransferase-like protein 13 [Lingula anatina]|eukprot:XP_013399663.1 methyltransferase-like protein 13 [Lingula anatina]
MPNMKQILEVCQLEDQVSRLESTDEMTTAVKEMQHYAMVRQQINKRSHPDDQIVLHLYGPTSSTSPRYTLHVVDSDRNARDNVFAIFIAPEGRETEWLFSTNEGRKQLSESAGFQRLVVVLLHRDHSYIDMENIKAELSGKVMELAPAELKNKTQVPFLSLGDGIGHRTIKHRGKSNTSGDYVIEDVESDNKELVRRLVFLSNPSLVQSEARLKQETSKKKSGKKKNVKRLVVDSSFLSCQHHSTITAGMALLGDFEKSLDSGLQMAIIGLGGGGLPLFIHDHFPKVSLDIVEIDDTVVSIAKEWFGFGSVTEERVHVFVKDGQDYVKELAAAGETKDVIIFDIDSKDSSVGMSSPPKGFVEAEFLKDVEKTLHSEGVFILNLVCRDKSLRESVVQNLKSVFKSVLNVKIPDEVNEIVFCLSNSRQSAVEVTQDSEILPETVTGALKKLQDSVDLKSNAAADVVNLTWRLEGLHIL